MPFTAGDLCCAMDACVLLDTSSSASSATWDRIPHVTQISFTKTANTPKIVTSSTNGGETSVCGIVSQTGNLAIACHNGASQPAPFCINGKYHIMWSIDCENIEDADPFEDPYYRAEIRITSVPVDFNIAGNAAVVFNYTFDIIEWIHEPSCQAEEE